jgi:hypothetical protein
MHKENEEQPPLIYSVYASFDATEELFFLLFGIHLP